MTPPFTASFCLLNVRGVNQTRKRRQLFRWLHNNKFDIIFLQKTYSTNNIETICQSECIGKIYFSHGTNCSRGVMTLFNPKLDVLVDSIETDKNGRYLILRATIHNSAWQLCNIYSPNNNSDQKMFLSNIIDIIRKRSDNSLIIGRDFNCALTPRDKISGTAVERKTNVISEITKLCDSFKLQDIWRCQHPNQLQFP